MMDVRWNRLLAIHGHSHEPHNCIQYVSEERASSNVHFAGCVATHTQADGAFYIEHGRSWRGGECWSTVTTEYIVIWEEA